MKVLRFSPPLLSNCESTTYPDFKKSSFAFHLSKTFDCVVQNLELGISDFDNVLKIIAFLLLLFRKLY